MELNVRKIFIIDTSVLLYDKSSIHSFPESDVVIPLVALDELDRFKEKKGITGESARYVNRFLDELRKSGNLHEGVELENGQTIKVALDGFNQVPLGLNGDDADNKMISLALKMTKEEDSPVVMITKDINFRVKCDALGVSSEDYYKDKIIDEEEKSYKGFVSIEVKEEMSYLIDLFYQEEDVTEDIEDILGRKLHPNEFINIKAGSQSLIGCKVNGKIKKLNSKCKSYVCDITNYNEIKDIINKQPKIDILVNNAGNNIPEHFTKVKTKNMEYLVKINTVATFNLAQLCALKMIKSKNRKKVGGAIINMSSQMGHVGGPIRSVYNMNKWGLEGLTKGMSLDLAKYNIRVNTVCPTFVVTPMTKKFLKNKKFKRETLNNIPLGRFAELSEISSAVVFLASDAASMITGTSLLVDGGWTAK